MKNIANADRPKSAAAMLPPRPLRGSGKVAQTACNSDRREGKSCIPTLNQTFADSRILKISKLRTFRIAVVIRREFSQEVEMVFAPGGDLVEIVARGDGGAGQQQQDLGQRVDDPPRLAVVIEPGKMLQQ